MPQYASVSVPEGDPSDSLTKCHHFADFPLDEKAGEFVALIFRTLPLYDDRKSQAAVERVLVDAINREPAFVKAFAGALVQTVEKSHSSLGNRSRFKLLQWISLLVRTSPDIVKAKGAFLRLAGALAVLLTDLLSGGPRVRKAAERQFRRLPTEVGCRDLPVVPVIQS